MAAREQNKQSTRKIGVRLLLVNEPVTKIESPNQLSLIDIGVSYYRIYYDANYVVFY